MRTKTETKRREILDAAVAEFSQRGFHETTLGHVAARMGSSKATIYNYFPTKNELFGAMLATAAMPATTALLATFDPAHFFADSLAAFARGYVRLQAGDEAVAIQRLIIAQNEKMSSALALLHDDPNIQIWPQVARIFEGAQRAGALVAGDCEQMTRRLSALLQGDLPLRALFGERDSFTAEEMDASADAATAMFLAAYGA